mmetsp:Transcript_5456/g.24252  ORF Transcript_5456/g.24252 Transcript_5456/m.24252 type:complete len:268 (-) Transcript_5456:70-873(-)
MRLRLRVPRGRGVRAKIELDFPRRFLGVLDDDDDASRVPPHAPRVPLARGVGPLGARGPRRQPLQLPETPRRARGHPAGGRQAYALHPGLVRRALAVLRLRQRARVRPRSQVLQGRGKRPAVGGRLPERPSQRRHRGRRVPGPARHRVHRRDGLADDMPRELAGGDRADGPRGAAPTAARDAQVVQHADTRQVAARDGDRGDDESHRRERRQGAVPGEGDDGAEGCGGRRPRRQGVRVRVVGGDVREGRGGAIHVVIGPPSLKVRRY